MNCRRSLQWVRLLCAVALGLGLSGAAAVAATTALQTQTRPAVEQLQGAAHDAATTAARAPLALGHAVRRRVPPSVGVALVATTVLVGGLVLSTRRRLRSTGGDERRTSPVGARAPPVAIGI